jgi:DNA end-binding protein Ku
VGADTNGEKPYALLFEAMRQSSYDGLAKVTMHGREHIVILRPAKRGIMLHTMYYADEVRDVPEVAPRLNLVKDKELQMAKALIETLVGDFRPEQYKDTYRENLEKLIAAKAKGKEITPAAEPKTAKVVDIMEALRKSLESKSTASKGAPAKKTSRRKKSAGGKAA